MLTAFCRYSRDGRRMARADRLGYRRWEVTLTREGRLRRTVKSVIVGSTKEARQVMRVFIRGK